MPDLLIVATGEVYGAVIVHYDRDFDTIAAITGQPVEWIVPPGSVPRESHVLAWPGTVSCVFPTAGSLRVPRASGRVVPTLRAGFVNGMSYQ